MTCVKDEGKLVERSALNGYRKEVRLISRYLGATRLAEDRRSEKCVA